MDWRDDIETDTRRVYRAARDDVGSDAWDWWFVGHPGSRHGPYCSEEEALYAAKQEWMRKHGTPSLQRHRPRSLAEALVAAHTGRLVP